VKFEGESGSEGSRQKGLFTMENMMKRYVEIIKSAKKHRLLWGKKISL